MRTFEQLSEAEQASAEEIATGEILRAILEGRLRFNDELNRDDLQARIDRALEASEENRTPWFAHEFLMEDPTVAESVRGMARGDAETALYPDPDQAIIRLPREEVSA